MRSLAFLLLIPSLALAQKRGAETKVDVSAARNTRALIVGISSYQSAEIARLKYAHVDAQAVHQFLINDLHIPSQNVRLILNEQATTGNVVMSLYELASQASDRDRIIIYFSGHGDVETLTTKQNGFLLTFDTNPQVYIGSALPVDALNQFVHDMSEKGAQVIVISDACRSGKLAGGAAGVRQASAVLAQQVKNEIRLLACQSHEVSMEGAQWGGGRGLFSYELLNGWRGEADLGGNMDGLTSLLELQTHLITKVPRQAAPGSQNPVVYGNVTEILDKVVSATAAGKVTREELLARVHTRGALKDSSYAAVLEQRIASDRLVGPGSAAEYYDQVSQAVDEETRHDLTRIVCSAFLSKANAFLNQYLNSKRLNSSVQEVTDNITCLTKASALLAGFPYYRNYLDSKTMFYEALLMSHQGIHDKAEQLLLQSVALEPEAAYTYNQLGVVQRELNKPDLAEKAFKNAIRLSPKWIYAHINLSDLLMSSGRTQEAIAHYRVLISQGVQTPVLFENLAAAYDMADSAEQAERYYQKAVDSGKLSQPLLNNISRHYLKLGNYQLALQYVNRSLEMSAAGSDADEAHLLAGIAHYYLSDFTKSAGHLDRSHATSPDRSKYLALANLRLGRTQPYKNALDEYLRVTGDGTIHYEIAAHHIGDEQYALALTHLEQVPPTHKPDEVKAFKALCSFNMENYEGVIAMLAGSANDQMQLLLGKSYIMAGDQDAALSAFGESVSLKPNFEAYFWISVIHLSRRNNAEAMGSLESAAALGLPKSLVDAQPVFRSVQADQRFRRIYDTLR